GAYWTLRVLRPAKLLVNLVLVSLVLVATLGAAARARRKTRVYAGLLVWHLRGCPEGAGLRYASSLFTVHSSRAQT
ncbi:MAG: hypothetical protein L0216_08685, partial [Planctomycetales bacterium]|nr:hypothetical protein [Planctomycetales bacterium]